MIVPIHNKLFYSFWITPFSEDFFWALCNDNKSAVFENYVPPKHKY